MDIEKQKEMAGLMLWNAENPETNKIEWASKDDHDWDIMNGHIIWNFNGFEYRRAKVDFTELPIDTPIYVENYGNRYLLAATKSTVWFFVNRETSKTNVSSGPSAVNVKCISINASRVSLGHKYV